MPSLAQRRNALEPAGIRAPFLTAAFALALLLGSGCLQGTPDATGTTTAPPAALFGPVSFTLHPVGEDGPEPTLGVAKDGSIFFQALEKTMKSTDHGASWANVNPPYALPTTLDPFLWLDPVTDRVFADQLYVACSYLSFSDDGGATWVANPVACGTPVNDHQKVTTGPYYPGSPLDTAAAAHKRVYPNVVYYGVNGLADSRIAMSIDGGVTFPFVSESFPAETPGETPQCGGGLHGSVTAGPDGAVYVPSRSNCPVNGTVNGGPVVARSLDNGLTWTNSIVGASVGSAIKDKNPELAVDANNTVYIAWPGGDNRLYLSHSDDHGASWATPALATPGLGTVTMPVIQAGLPGRIAMAYYAVGNASETSSPDDVADAARWGLYVTYSLDALSDAPTFHTFLVTGDDPIQVGGISTNSAGSSGAERNLLDFIDMVLDADGRVHVAFADGCTSMACTGPGGKNTDSRSAAGMVAIAQEGPSLTRDAWLHALG